MNKLKQYLSLMVVTATVLSINAMDLEQAPAEEARDAFAILAPRLNSKKKEELQATVDWADEDATPEEICKAYRAATVLEIDQDPLHRDKKLVARRKELWGQVKATDTNAPQLVHYLTGSEDEQDVKDETARLNQVVARIQRREKQLALQAPHVQTLKAQKVLIKANGKKIAEDLAQVTAKKEHIEVKQAETDKELRSLQNDEAKLLLGQKAVARLLKAAFDYAQDEPDLRDIPIEKFALPTLEVDRNAKKVDHTQKQANVLVVLKTVSTQLKEISAEEKQVKTLQAENGTAQDQLAQLIAQAKDAQELAQTDKEKLLAALDQQLEISEEKRQAAEDEVAGLANALADETKANKKVALNVRLTQKQRELTAFGQTITNLTIARAQADGTYSKPKEVPVKSGLFGWLAGK